MRITVKEKKVLLKKYIQPTIYSRLYSCHLQLFLFLYTTLFFFYTCFILQWNTCDCIKKPNDEQSSYFILVYLLSLLEQ